jgi:4-amino-4-deoxy-L-arabinose transferase-like glycosyltransferase
MNLLRNKIFILVLAALITRLAAIVLYQGVPYYDGITRGYLHVIQNALDGRGFVVHVDIAPLNAPEPHWSYEPFIDRPLGFALLLLLPSVVSTHRIFLQLFLALLSVCSVFLLFRWGTIVVNERAAFIAALIYALWPLSARIETLILPDAVISLFLLAALWLIYRALRSDHPYRGILTAGIALGAATVIRSDMVLLPFFLAAGILLLATVRRWKLVTMLLAGFAVVLALQTARNYQVTGGKILPLGLGNGISMWEGISQFGDTLGTVYGDERMTSREGYYSWAYPNGIERDQKRFREALDIIEAHPVWYAGVMTKRIWMLIKPDGILTASLAPTPQEYSRQNPGALWWNYWLDYPLASISRIAVFLGQMLALILACAALIRFRPNRDLWLPAIVIIYYIAIHVGTNAEARYFYPVTPLLLFLAVYGWNKMQTHRRNG